LKCLIWQKVSGLEGLGKLGPGRPRQGFGQKYLLLLGKVLRSYEYRDIFLKTNKVDLCQKLPYSYKFITLVIHSFVMNWWLFKITSSDFWSKPRFSIFKFFYLVEKYPPRAVQKTSAGRTLPTPDLTQPLPWNKEKKSNILHFL